MHRWILALTSIALLGTAGSASAFSMGLSASFSSSMGMDFVTFHVFVTPDTMVTGYDLTFAWDATELELNAYAPQFTGAFGIPLVPGVSDPMGSRASNVVFTPVPLGPTVDVTFKIMSPSDDGVDDDFRVFIGPGNGPGIAPSGVSTIVIENPQGWVVDLRSTSDADISDPSHIPEPAAWLMLGAALPLLRRFRS